MVTSSSGLGDLENDWGVGVGTATEVQQQRYSNAVGVPPTTASRVEGPTNSIQGAGPDRQRKLQQAVVVGKQLRILITVRLKQPRRALNVGHPECHGPVGNWAAQPTLAAPGSEAGRDIGIADINPAKPGRARRSLECSRWRTCIGPIAGKRALQRHVDRPQMVLIILRTRPGRSFSARQSTCD